MADKYKIGDIVAWEYDYVIVEIVDIDNSVYVYKYLETGDVNLHRWGKENFENTTNKYIVNYNEYWKNLNE